MTTTSLQTLVQQVLSGNSLSCEQSRQFFGAVVQGQADPLLLTALLVALKMRGETAEEIAGAALALRDAATPFPSREHSAIDCCGTGGDGSNTINISTTAAIVAAAMGLTVAKHGNRSVSSQSGSADLFEQLGLDIQMSPQQAANLLSNSGCAFLFAPLYHAGIRHAMPVRNTLKTRTLFNLLGPLLNPAQPDFQLLGVYDASLCRVMAEALQQLGITRAWVVHGSGCDEIALHGPTTVVEIAHGQLREFTLTAADFGLPAQPLQAVAGGNPQQNAAATLAILQGKGATAHKHAVAANVAAMLKICGKGEDLAANTAAVLALLNTDQGYQTLQKMKEVRHG